MSTCENVYAIYGSFLRKMISGINNRPNGYKLCNVSTPVATLEEEIVTYRSRMRVRVVRKPIPHPLISSIVEQRARLRWR